MSSATEAAMTWVKDLYRGEGLDAWNLTHEPQRVELVRAWHDWAAASGADAIAWALGPDSTRDLLVAKPDAVQPSPEMWRALRDFTRALFREFAPGIQEPDRVFVARSEPVGVNREIVRYVRLPPGGVKDFAIVDAIAIELLLVDGVWRVVGPRPCASFQRRVSALSGVQ